MRWTFSSSAGSSVISRSATAAAARVQATADSGQILVSNTVKDLVVGSGLRFVDRGEHDLKGVPGPWRLHAVIGDAER